MAAKAIHLNLLRESEVLSSSPIRLRVMAPVAAMLASAAMLLWWAILYGNILIGQSEVKSLQSDIDTRAKANAEVLEDMKRVNELESECEQLSYYAHGRRTWGETLAKLAEAVPLKVQFTRVEIPAPPPQNLARPKGSKLPPLWGPTSVVERASLVLAGRTTKDTPVISLMETLEGDAFTNELVIVKDPRSPDKSPNVRSFRQEATTAAAGAGARMLSFEIEYRAKERRFAP